MSKPWATLQRSSQAGLSAFSWQRSSLPLASSSTTWTTIFKPVTLLEHHNIFTIHVAAPELYIKMLSELERAPSGQLYTLPVELRRHYNSAHVSITLEDGEHWDAACIAFVELVNRSPGQWARHINAHLMPYINNHVLPAWQRDTGRPEWRLCDVLGWRLMHHRIFKPAPGAYVVIDDAGHLRAINDGANV